MESGEVIRITLSHDLLNGSTGQNVFYWRMGGLGAEVSDDEVFDELEGWFEGLWGPDWQDIGSVGAKIIEMSGDIINTDLTVKRHVGVETLDITGTVGGEIAPAAVSGLLQASTAVSGVRGMKYVTGMAEGQLINGLFDSEAVADLLILLADWLIPILLPAAVSLISGVMSSKIDNFVDFNLSGTASDVPAYQRRRKPNVGI